MSQEDEPNPPAMQPSAPVPAGAFILGPRPVAMTSALVAVACLGALVIVATQKNVDALSTIALALAILAFAAQLIIYIAQAGTSNQQLYLSQIVQADTARMLAGIEARIQVTAEAQREALSRAVPRLVDTAVSADRHRDEAAGGGADPDPEAVERTRLEMQQLSDNLTAIIREELAKAQARTYDVTPSAWATFLARYPEAGGGAALPYIDTTNLPRYIVRSEPRSYGATLREAGAKAARSRNRYVDLNTDEIPREPFTFSKGTPFSRGTESSAEVKDDPAAPEPPPKAE